MQLVVQPEKVAVAARDGKLGVAVALGRRLGRDRVLGVGARQVAHLVGVADRDGERGLRGLLDADAGLCLALGGGVRGRLDGGRYAGALRGAQLVVVVVVEVDRVHHATQRGRRGGPWRAAGARSGLLLGRGGGSSDGGLGA